MTVPDYWASATCHICGSLLRFTKSDGYADGIFNTECEHCNTIHYQVNFKSDIGALLQWEAARDQILEKSKEAAAIRC